MAMRLSLPSRFHPGRRAPNKGTRKHRGKVWTGKTEPATLAVATSVSTDKWKKILPFRPRGISSRLDRADRNMGLEWLPMKYVRLQSLFEHTQACLSEQTQSDSTHAKSDGKLTCASISNTLFVAFGRTGSSSRSFFWSIPEGQFSVGAPYPDRPLANTLSQKPAPHHTHASAGILGKAIVAGRWTGAGCGPQPRKPRKPRAKVAAAAVPNRSLLCPRPSRAEGHVQPARSATARGSPARFTCRR